MTSSHLDRRDARGRIFSGVPFDLEQTNWTGHVGGRRVFLVGQPRPHLEGPGLQSLKFFVNL